MLIFKAIIDEDTCDVCKERNGKKAELDALLVGKFQYQCENENGCRCIIEEDCRPWNYRQDVSV
jgi:hypothetical protein